MSQIINRVRYISLIFCVFFSIYTLKFYEGSKVLFMVYNLILILLVYNLTNYLSSFFSFFLAFYIFMGFWFKFNLSLIFNDGYIFDSGMMVSNNIDNVLIISIYIFLTIILANLFSKYFTYNKYDSYSKINLIYKFYSRFKIYIIILFIISVSFNGYLNFSNKIYIKGLIFENDYNFLSTNFIKWLLLFGLTTFSCYFLNKETKKGGKFLILFYLMAFFELFISNTSMLSRSLLLFGLPFVYAFIFYEEQKTKGFTSFFVIILLFISFSVVSIYLSNKSRAFHIYSLKDQVKIEYEKLNSNEKDILISDKKKNFENSDKFNFQINEVLTEAKKADSKKITSFIIINRWVGIDSLINVSRSDKLSFKLFFESFSEKKSKFGNTFYENNFNLEYKKPTFYSGKTFVKGNTLPGLFSFLYYSGSIPFLLFSLFFLVLFFIYFEKIIFNLSKNNLFFVSFISHLIANRIFSFGYAPKDTYLFASSISLCILLIYFLETDRFDKIFINLK